jgi:Xaa-Pro aminopeptidase
MAALQKREVKSAATKVERLRLIKSEAEVKAMRRAADISADAHSKVSKGLFRLDSALPMRWQGR